jgi:pyrimidine-nucleoside phosphorylase
VLQTITFSQAISKKRDGLELSKQEISFLISGYTNGTIPDYQMSSLLMAIYTQGMTKQETAWLTEAMLYSGKTLTHKSNKVVDKHSTGGIGDKTSFIIAPIAAAAGVDVPMIAGRGLGHTGGTIDKLNAIKGMTTKIPPKKFIKQLEEIGLVLAGQSKIIAPADKKVYALRDVTGTIESIPLITASIMSKKLAEGINGLVFDVKTGSGAFMSKKSDAKALAKSLKDTSLAFGKDVYTMITDMSQPLGDKVGHSLELIESVEVLKGKGPKDLIEICIELAGAMIHLSGASKNFSEGKKAARKVIKNGSALKKFTEVIKAQGGDPSFIKDYKKLPSTKFTHTIVSPKDGYITKIEGKKTGLACITIGGGRNVKEDKIDLGAGFDFHLKVGGKVKKGTPLVTIHHNISDQKIIKSLELNFLESIYKFSSKKPKQSPLMIETKSYFAKK